MGARTGKQNAGNRISLAYGLDADPDRQNVVRRIYDEFLHPYRHDTLSVIAEGLNADSIPTARGGRWYPATVKYLLANPAYVPTVVSEDVFQRAQARLLALRPGPPR